MKRNPYNIEIDDLSRFGAKKHTTTATLSLEERKSSFVSLPKDLQDVLLLVLAKEQKKISEAAQDSEDLQLLGDLVRAQVMNKFSCFRRGDGTTEYKLGSNRD